MGDTPLKSYNAVCGGAKHIISPRIWLVNIFLHFLGGNMATFPERLKELRKRHKISQKALGEAVSGSEGGIQKYELGVNKPTMDVLVNIADYFDVSVDYLIGRSDNPERR